MRPSLVLALAVALLPACADPGESGAPADTADSGETGETGETGESGETGETGETGDDTILRLDATTNYTFTSSLSVGVLPAAAGVDTTVDWSALTTDLSGRAFDPAADVAQLGLAWIPSLTRAEVEAALLGGTLLQEDVAAVYTVSPSGRTTAKLSELSAMGDRFDPASTFLAGSGVWLGVIVPRDRGGAAMLAFFEPEDGAPVVDLAFTSTTATLTFAATFGPALVAPTTGPWGADWSGLDVGASGAPLSTTPVDQVWIGRFDGVDLATLAAEFPRAEDLATGAWSARVSGAASLDDLAEARDAAGEAFPGFDATSTWILALRCSLCPNPAPPYVGVVEVAP